MAGPPLDVPPDSHGPSPREGRFSESDGTPLYLSDLPDCA